jgi:hypothetical protein
MDEHIYVDLPTCTPNSDLHVTAKTINPIRIPPTITPVNKNNHHLSLIVFEIKDEKY